MLEPIGAVKLTDQATSLLEAAILSGQYQVGELLPPERSLSEQLQVSRRVVREALKTLEAKGLVSVRRGIGAYVTRNDLDNFLEALSGNIASYVANRKGIISDIEDFRRMVEGESVRRLTTSVKSNDTGVNDILDGLGRAIAIQQAGKDGGDSQLYSQGHFMFHHDLVESMGNPITTMLYKQVINLIEKAMLNKSSSPGVMERATREHLAVLDSIRAGDETAALGRLHVHLHSFKVDMGDAEV